MTDAEIVTLEDSRRVTVRPLSTGDATALGDFYESIPAADERFYRPHPLTREEASRVAADADNGTFVCLVAERPDGAIAGYAWLRWKEGADRSGFGICISTGYKGVGLGRALTSRIAEVACTVGPPVIGLTVQKANLAAFDLYRSMGFEVVREQLRRGDGEPEYYMERRVR